MNNALNVGESSNAPVSEPSVYARVFDETNVNWERKPEYTLLFLKNVQNYANDFLQVRGHVFLNDVYDRLGFPRTSEGQVVGWLWDGKDPKYVDIMIQGFQTNGNSAITLDFNVQGIIYDKI
jgi:hypothetical protein